MENSGKPLTDVNAVEEHLTINSIESMDSSDCREDEIVRNNLLLEDFQTMKHETHDRESAMDYLKKMTKYKTMVYNISNLFVFSLLK